jgi:hypothetical protein
MFYPVSWNSIQLSIRNNRILLFKESVCTNVDFYVVPGIFFVCHDRDCGDSADTLGSLFCICLTNGPRSFHYTILQDFRPCMYLNGTCSYLFSHWNRKNSRFENSGLLRSCANKTGEYLLTFRRIVVHTKSASNSSKIILLRLLGQLNPEDEAVFYHSTQRNFPFLET